MSRFFLHASQAFVLTAWVLLFVVAPASAQPVEHLLFEERTYELDGYGTLFDTSTPRGQLRYALFTDYVARSVEGQERRRLSNSRDPMVIWRDLDKFEKATFVAITAALHCMQVDGGIRMLEWISSIDEIHGKTSVNGQTFPGNEAFRLWVRFEQNALDILKDEESRQDHEFHNVCTGILHEFGGDGSHHPDFCRPDGQDFRHQAKINDAGGGVRGIQFNFNDRRCSDCVDVDIDYSVDCHIFPGNSNVLDDCRSWLIRRENQIDWFVDVYGARSGLRLLRDPQGD